jgi:serine/threonine-protein kinase
VEAQLRVVQARNQEIVQLNQELRRQIEQRSHRLMDLLLAQDLSNSKNPALPMGGLLGECYRVVRLIGEGGMGVVYEVERTTDGRRLAAKVLRSRPNRHALQRFAREAQILARLNHPSLISIFDLDITSEGGLYIVMELISGSSLWEQHARFGQVKWALCVLRQVAQALSVLHAQSVIHRDLKPANILLPATAPDAEPVVKLADFGISLMLDEVSGSGPLKTPGTPPAAVERPAHLDIVTQDDTWRASIGSANTEPGQALVEVAGQVVLAPMPVN